MIIYVIKVMNFDLVNIKMLFKKNKRQSYLNNML